MLEAVRDEAGELGCEVSRPRAGREAHGASPPLEATCEQHETAEPCLSEAARISTLCAESFRPALVGRQCNVMKHHQCSKKATTDAVAKGDSVRASPAPKWTIWEFRALSGAI